MTTVLLSIALGVIGGALIGAQSRSLSRIRRAAVGELPGTDLSPAEAWMMRIFVGVSLLGLVALASIGIWIIREVSHAAP